MQRFTISLDPQLAHDFDHLIAARGYTNRSEAVRDLIRTAMTQQPTVGAAAGHCVAHLSFVYNHHERGLAERLTAVQHAHHDLVVSTLHTHLDHNNCLEAVVLNGPVAQVRALAEGICAQSGVRHGQLNLIPVQRSGTHQHGAESPAHSHHQPLC